jgi:predicted ester cyclase
MSTDGNKSTVRRFITEVIEQGNMSYINQLCGPTYVNRLTGGGIESFKQASGLMRTAAPGWHFNIEDLVAEGDDVVARFTVTGTVSGSVMGSKPSGKAFSVHGLAFYRLANGKIVEDDPIMNQDVMQLFGIQMPAQSQSGQA